jgi:RNA polymerase-binding transcription factor DksA
MSADLTPFRIALEEERSLLEKELASVGGKNPDEPVDWEPTADPDTEEESDIADRADDMEDFAERAETEMTLEDRLRAVVAAIERIDQGTYGTCATCGKHIEVARLQANPAALTCAAHRNI